MLLIGRLFGAALAREDMPLADRRPMHVYIDEFQNFVTGTAGQMMAEARKYGLCLTLANQTLAQLDDKLRDMVLGNAATMLAFRTGPSDAAALEPFFAPALDRLNLQALANFQCATRALSGGAPVVPPFVMAMAATPAAGGCAAPESLIERSRERCARKRADVQRELAGRRE